jgi:hypothetical protein
MTSAFSLLALIPTLLVEGIAIAVALSRWQRHPNVSMLVTVGMILRIGATIGTTLAFTLVHDRIGLLGIISGAGNVVGMAGLVLVLAAAFADRPTS